MIDPRVVAKRPPEEVEVDPPHVVARKDRHTADAASHDVVHAIRLLNAGETRHTSNVAGAGEADGRPAVIVTNSARGTRPGSDPGVGWRGHGRAATRRPAAGTIGGVPRRGDSTSTTRGGAPPRPSAKRVLLAVAVAAVLLFAAGVAVQMATRNTDAVDFRGGRYVDPVPLTRAQVEHDYGRFRRAPGRIDGRNVLVPTRAPTTDPPRLLFVVDRNGRTGVLYGLSK